MTHEEIEELVDRHTDDVGGYDIWCDGRGVAEEAYRKGVEDAAALLHAHPMWAAYILKTLLKDT